MDDIRTGIDRKTHRLREESLARKRNQEYHKQLYWNDTTNYYKIWGVQASKYNVWASQPNSPVSVECRKETEKTSLEERRAKLCELLASEQKQYEEEVKECKRIHKKDTSPYDNIPKKKLEKMNLQLKLREEEGRSYKAAVQKYHQYKSSHPILQNFEKKRNQETMKKGWIEQIKEKQQQKANEKELMLKLEDEATKQKIIEEEKEKEVAQRKQEEMKNLKEFLLHQMEKMRIKDELSRELKQQEEREIKLKTELEKIAVHRNHMEKQRRTKQLRSILKHQYRAQLKQRTREIQDELKEDKRLIDEITQCLEKEEMENNKIKEETRKGIDRANAMLAQYAKLEKQREREMEFMFLEEARKMWQKQEANWNVEQEARDMLMRDVLVTLQKQVKEKLEQNAEQYEVLLQEKDELLHKIEDANKQLKDNEKNSNQKKKEYMADLREQIREKELEKENLKLEEEKEFREKQAKLKEEEEKILEELRKLSTASRNPITRQIIE